MIVLSFVVHEMWAYVCVEGGKKLLFVPEYVFILHLYSGPFPDAAELIYKS